MDLKDYLTNEKVAKKFKNQFDMVNYAIKLATNMIQTGRESRVKLDSQNRAMHILTEILQDKDRFDDVVKKEPVDAYASTTRFDTFDDEDDKDDVLDGKEAKKSSKASAKSSDKKLRKILN